MLSGTSSNPISRWLLRKARIKGPFWFLIPLVGFFSINNVFWLKRNLLAIPPPWDQAFYLYMSVRYLHAFQDGGFLALFKEFVHLSSTEAPLFPLTALPLYLVFGESRVVAHLTNAFYLLLLLLGVYLIGEYIYGRKTGILAVFLASTFTAIINFSRDYLYEFPSAAFITLGVYALMRSEEFQHRSWSLGFGVLAGLAALTKTMAGVFFVGPVLYSLRRVVKQRLLHTSILVNFLLSIGVAVLVASVWWGPNFPTALGKLIYRGFGEASIPYRKGLEPFTLQNLSYYFVSVVNHGVSFFYALLFVALALSRGVSEHLCRKKSSSPEMEGARKWGYLWMWLVISYAILTAARNKGEERYALPLLPPLAVLLAAYIGVVGHKWLRRSVVVAAITIGTFNYSGLTYETRLTPQRLHFPPFAIISHDYPHYSSVRRKLHLSPETRWPIHDLLSVVVNLGARRGLVDGVGAEILDRVHDLSDEDYVRTIYRVLLRRKVDEEGFQYYVDALKKGRITRESLTGRIASSSEFKNRRSKVLVVPDHPVFNSSTLRYYAEVYRYPLIFSHISDGPISRDRLQEYDFALVKSRGYQGLAFSTRYCDQILAELLAPRSAFVALPQTFAFPDDSHIIIFAGAHLLS